MKQLLFLVFASTIFVGPIYSQETEDEEQSNCKDYPMLSGMPKFDISDCRKNYKDFEVKLSEEESKTIEGTNFFHRYAFNDENAQGPSWFQVFKNYENAITKLGGKTLFNDKDGIGNFYLKKDKMEIYFNIYGSGGNADEISEYLLTVIEVEAMAQEITATDIYKNLEKDGFMAVDIQFETGKSTIKVESNSLIGVIAEMLKNNASLSISIEGHTDNVGEAAANMTLSQNRALSVMNALVAKGIEKGRLSTKGFGASSPVADNRTEEGRAKNRRVELVKK
jgi:OOP family OmpA-OmpF porin